MCIIKQYIPSNRTKNNIYFLCHRRHFIFNSADPYRFRLRFISYLFIFFLFFIIDLFFFSLLLSTIFYWDNFWWTQNPDYIIYIRYIILHKIHQNYIISRCMLYNILLDCIFVMATYLNMRGKTLQFKWKIDWIFFLRFLEWFAVTCLYFFITVYPIFRYIIGQYIIVWWIWYIIKIVN